MSKQISSHDVQKMTGIIKNKLSIRRWSENHETAAQSDIKYNFEPFNGCACRGGGYDLQATLHSTRNYD